MQSLENRIEKLERSALHVEGLLQRAEFMSQVKYLAVQPDHVVSRQLAPRRQSVVISEHSNVVAAVDASAPPVSMRSSRAEPERHRYSASLQQRMTSVRQVVADIQTTLEFLHMSPELGLARTARNTVAALLPTALIDPSKDMFVAMSDALPIGRTDIGIFFGGTGAQSDVEIGIAQHNAEFKWMLKLSADGSIAVNNESEDLSSWALGSAVDAWQQHGPGDVIRMSITREPLQDAQDDSETTAFISFQNLLSPEDTSGDEQLDGLLPTHTECKGLQDVTDEFLFQGPLAFFARLYRAGDAVALVPPELPPFMRQALQLTRNLRKEMSLLMPMQRDFSSSKIKRSEMGSLLGEEMRCTGAIRGFVREIDAVMHKAIRFILKTVEDAEKSLKEYSLFQVTLDHTNEAPACWLQSHVLQDFAADTAL